MENIQLSDITKAALWAMQHYAYDPVLKINIYEQVIKRNALGTNQYRGNPSDLIQGAEIFKRFSNALAIAPFLKEGISNDEGIKTARDAVRREIQQSNLFDKSGLLDEDQLDLALTEMEKAIKTAIDPYIAELRNNKRLGVRAR